MVNMCSTVTEIQSTKLNQIVFNLTSVFTLVGDGGTINRVHRAYSQDVGIRVKLRVMICVDCVSSTLR